MKKTLGQYIASQIAYHDEERDRARVASRAESFGFHQGAAHALWLLGIEFGELAEFYANVRKSVPPPPLPVAEPCAACGGEGWYITPTGGGQPCLVCKGPIR